MAFCGEGGIFWDLRCSESLHAGSRMQCNQSCPKIGIPMGGDVIWELPAASSSAWRSHISEELVGGGGPSTDCGGAAGLLAAGLPVLLPQRANGGAASR